MKKILFLGDSITQGAAASKVENIYYNVAARILGVEAKGYGLGGTRIAEQTIPFNGQSCYDESFFQRAQTMDKEADLVVVFGGTNDFGHGDSKLGTPDSTDIHTFYGAVKNLFNYLIGIYGKDKVMVILPLKRFDDEDPLGEFGVARKVPGPILIEYVDILRKVANSLSLKVCDVREQMGKPVSRNPEELYQDGLHPTDIGHEKLGHLVAKFIQDNF